MALCNFGSSGNSSGFLNFLLRDTLLISVELLELYGSVERTVIRRRFLICKILKLYMISWPGVVN